MGYEPFTSFGRNLILLLSMTIIQDQRTQFKKVGDADPEIIRNT